jgi:ABC-2 type transport system permease protein
MSAIFLVARRDYLAYIGAWGFWISLLLAPLIIGVLMFAPLLLARAEPPRVLAVLAEQQADGALVTNAFLDMARRDARREIGAYVDAAAPAIAAEVMAAFDAAPDRPAAIAAARAVVVERLPQALRAFPAPSPRYIIVDPPATEVQALRPYLDGTRTLADGRSLYGALNVRRVNGDPIIEYWSVNLSHGEPSDIASRALRLAMQREAMAAHGLDPGEADRLNAFDPQIAQFDPRATASGEQVTLRDRAPFYAAIALAFILWSVVFSVANMLLTGVIEEKSNKILDTLLTSHALSVVGRARRRAVGYCRRTSFHVRVRSNCRRLPRSALARGVQHRLRRRLSDVRRHLPRARLAL